MNILILQSSPRANGNTAWMAEEYKKAAEATIEEFLDEHDTPDTKYIVIIDDYLPVATCRLYAINNDNVITA
ncbi:MAG: hypothetical protein IJ647_10000 [Prevotella sp.]|nr:hypothetical protein [Prevotella sp.]